jgi:hypothetical protein
MQRPRERTISDIGVECLQKQKAAKVGTNSIEQDVEIAEETDRNFRR